MSRRMIKSLGLVFWLSVGWLALGVWFPVMAKTIDVPKPIGSANIQANLQQAVDQAVSGDVVELPAGEFYVDGQVVVQNKFVSLKGQGSEGGTVLYRRDTVSDSTLVSSTWRYMVKFLCNSDVSSQIVVSDIHFRSKTPSVVLGDGKSEADDYGLYFQQCVDFVVRDSMFEHFGHAAIYVAHKPDVVRGVIAHNRFLNNLKKSRAGTSVNTTVGYGVQTSGGNQVWVPDAHLGSANFIFVEDNYFVGHRHAIASGSSGVYVFRYNLVEDNLVAQAVDAHGASFDNKTSTRAYEVYNNRIINRKDRMGSAISTQSPATCSSFQYKAMALRGGEGMVFDNQIEGYQTGVQLFTEWTLYSDTAQAWPKPAYAEEVGQIGYLSGKKYGVSHTGFDSDKGDGDVFIWGNEFLDTRPGCTQVVNQSFVNQDGLIKKDRDYHMLTATPSFYKPYIYPHPLLASLGGGLTVTPTPISGLGVSLKQLLAGWLESIGDKNNDGIVNSLDFH